MGLFKTKDSNTNNTTRYYSTKQEKHIAKTLNGDRTPNSGATMFAKGDIKLDKFLLECKTKMKSSDSITIRKEWLDKLNAESLFMGKPYSALAFNFGPDEDNHYIINEELFEKLINYLDSNAAE